MHVRTPFEMCVEEIRVLVTAEFLSASFMNTRLAEDTGINIMVLGAVIVGRQP